MVLSIIVACACAGLLTPYPADAVNTTHLEVKLAPPSGAHLMGTDQLGRDVFSRVLFGGQVSLGIGVGAVVLAALAGTLIGIFAGYGPRWIDELLMRIADVFLGVPSLVLAVLVTLTLGGGAEMTALAIALTSWPRYARLIRGEVLRVKILEFVEAAYAYGARPSLIVRRHIFPGTQPALITQATLQFGQAILVAAALGFLGLGAHPPAPEWGLSIAIGREFLPESWWVSFFPGVMIVLVVVGLNFVGDSVRVALDARTDIGT
jgi:peptide/nickel transport system permease protein